MQWVRQNMLCLAIFVAEGPLKKLYERIRSQRENWQQRSLHESHEIDAGGSRSESGLHEGIFRTDSQLVLRMLVILF